MIALLQRVTDAEVSVAGQCIARIDAGLLVFVAVVHSDGPMDTDALAARVLALRVFNDTAGKMNLAVAAVGGSVLAVPQFTLAAVTDAGARPSFTPAAAPAVAAPLFDRFLAKLATGAVPVASGRFGADMQVRLTNDGPATFWLETRPLPTTLSPTTLS